MKENGMNAQGIPLNINHKGSLPFFMRDFSGTFYRKNTSVMKLQKNGSFVKTMHFSSCFRAGKFLIV